jgi:hypothetical protein
MANQIALFGQTGLPVGIYASFHDQTNDLILATGAEALHIKAQAEAYAQSLELLNGIVKRSTAYVSQRHFVSATGCF